MKTKFGIENPRLAEPIADEITSWLHREAVTSTQDRNAYLDDLTLNRKHLGLELDDPTNYGGSKHFSHFSRQVPWGKALMLEPANDNATGRHIFNSLMQMSGNSKRLLYFKAADQDDYIYRKTRPDIIGINVLPHVMTVVLNQKSDFRRVKYQPVTAEKSQQQTLAEFLALEKDLEFIRSRVPDDFGQEESPAVQRLSLRQASWARLIASHIFMAMDYRDGDLRAVPFLEPKSISDEPQVYYPFARI